MCCSRLKISNWKLFSYCKWQTAKSKYKNDSQNFRSQNWEAKMIDPSRSFWGQIDLHRLFPWCGNSFAFHGRFCWRCPWYGEFCEYHGRFHCRFPQYSTFLPIPGEGNELLPHYCPAAEPTGSAIAHISTVPTIFYIFMSQFRGDYYTFMREFLAVRHTFMREFSVVQHTFIRQASVQNRHSILFMPLLFTATRIRCKIIGKEPKASPSTGGPSWKKTSSLSPQMRPTLRRRR